ncbi:hypothetical protein DSCO28_30310 [Desulfosarcina ovata subsp. sediminis]|uniref:Cytotoxic translational repressor of toxin-antitoxin stability system n=1 Tax=Desulfosarcina ovata subsp. sediminis TaxID=885957 RepID=A0A5K7ZP29_9BACT|nr:hypothetical protein DSCO28_30310 [Desulfosarcina ovata subsp. sediminis]
MSLWQVVLSKKAAKQTKALPKVVQENLYALIRQIEIYGPIRGDWPNYSKLSPGRHHCHIKKGRPTYVAVWEVRNRTIQLIEVTYAGTHEKAPY